MLFKGTKVLVAGATGLIGSNLVKRLLDEGAQVRATVFRSDPANTDPRIEYVRCDLRLAQDCARAVEGMNHVHLCAASTSGAAAIAATPMIHVTPNVLINSQMLEAAYNANVEKFIWLGSTVAYPMSSKPMHEEDLMTGEPFEKYFFAGWAKRFMEVLCQMYGERLTKKMTTIVLRPTNVYGPNDDFEFATSHVIPALIRKTIERWDPIEIWGDGSEIRDAIYVDDMIEAMVLAASQLQSYAAINIGLGKGYSVREILKIVLEADGYEDAQIKFDPSKPTMIPIRLIDTSKAESVLGFKAKVDLQEGVRRTIEWYRRTHNLLNTAKR